MSGQLTVGSVEVISLTDAQGPFPLKVSQLFPGTTAEQWEPYRKAFPETFVDPDTWHAHIGSYLVRSRGRTLVVDTGVGPNPDPFFGELRGALPGALADAGVRPEEVDAVVLTHLHPDHVGWNLTAERKPFFAKARYVVHQADWDAFQSKEVQAAFPFAFVDETITPLENLGVLDLLSGEKALTEEVVAIPTPGHTPGHISILISSGGEQALILGDALVHAAQVSEPEWVFAFDMDSPLAALTRQRLLNRMETEKITAVQCHFPSPGFGRIVRLEGKRFWQAL